jgi:hypothetical protein
MMQNRDGLRLEDHLRDAAFKFEVIKKQGAGGSAMRFDALKDEESIQALVKSMVRVASNTSPSFWCDKNRFGHGLEWVR